MVLTPTVTFPPVENPPAASAVNAPRQAQPTQEPTHLLLSVLAVVGVEVFEARQRFGEASLIRIAGGRALCLKLQRCGGRRARELDHQHAWRELGSEILGPSLMFDLARCPLQDVGVTKPNVVEGLG